MRKKILRPKQKVWLQLPNHPKFGGQKSSKSAKFSLGLKIFVAATKSQVLKRFLAL